MKTTTARITSTAQRAEQDAQAADAALRRAQLAVWMNGDPDAADALPALLQQNWTAAYRANTAAAIAERHSNHRPTGTRPVYSSAPGSTARTIRAALRGRRHLLVLRIGFQGAWFECRDQQSRPAIFAVWPS